MGATEITGRMRRLRKQHGSVLDTDLLVPTEKPGLAESNELVLQEETELPIGLVLDDEGRMVLPAFTTERALVTWLPAGSRYLALQGSVLLRLLVDNDWD